MSASEKGGGAASPPLAGPAEPTFPRECDGFLRGSGFRLEGMLGGYAFRSPSDVDVVAADATGATVVSLGAELAVWDAATGARRAAYPLSGKAMAVEGNGRAAVIGQRHGSVARVDLATGALLWDTSLVHGTEGSLGHRIVPPVLDVAIGGAFVAATLETGDEVHILRDGQPVRRIPGSGAVALSPDGSLLVVGASVVEVASGAVLATFPRGAAQVAGTPRHVARFSRDGVHLAHTNPGGEVEVWSVAALRSGAGAGARVFASTMPVAPWDREGRLQPALAVFALEDGAVITSTGAALQVWRSGSRARTLPFHSDMLGLGHAGALVWGVRRRRTIVSIDAATGVAAGQLGHLAEVKAIAHSPRAPLALTGGGDARVLLWHLPTSTVLRELPDAWGSIEGAVFFPDGRRVAAIDRERMFVWDAATRQLVAKLDRVSPRETGLRDNVDLDASPDGRHALVCTHSDHVLLWDAEAARTVYCREVEGVRSAAFGPLPSIAILGSWRELVVFDLARGEPVRHIEVEHDESGHRAHLVFDEGRRAVRPCTGRGLFVYDLETSQRSLVPVTDDVHHLLALAPDGGCAVVSTSDDPAATRAVLRPEVALVRLADGARTTIPLSSAADHPTCASFSGDGSTLLVGTARGVVLRFALETPSSAVSPIATSATVPAAEEAATRVMQVFPDLRPPTPVGHVVIAPPSADDDAPVLALGSTSPRAGAGQSSARPGTLEAQREEAIAILRRVDALHARGAYNEALAFAAPLRNHLFESFPPGDPLLAASVANLAELHTRVGELALAEALHAEALDRISRAAGPSSEAFATILSNAGNFALERRDLPRAEALHRQALDIRRVLHGDQHALTAQSTSSLGYVLARMGRADLAEPLYRAALDAFRATVGPTHPEHAKTLHNLGVLLGRAGRHPESEAMLVESLSTRRRVLPGGHLDIAQGMASLGTLYVVSHRPALAEPLYREALEITRRSLGDAAIETSTRAVDLAASLRALGRDAEAIALLQRALEMRMGKLAADDPRVNHVRRRLAELGVP